MANPNPKNQWTPGQSGNPNGRPKKGETLTDILKARLPKEEFIEREIALAMEGDPAARKQIWERLDGKVKEQVEIDKKRELLTLEEKQRLIDELE